MLLVAAAIMALGPISWTLRMCIGVPLAPADLFAPDATDEDLRRALSQVQSAVKALVDR